MKKIHLSREAIRLYEVIVLMAALIAVLAVSLMSAQNAGWGVASWLPLSENDLVHLSRPVGLAALFVGWMNSARNYYGYLRPDFNKTLRVALPNAIGAAMLATGGIYTIVYRTAMTDSFVITVLIFFVQSLIAAIAIGAFAIDLHHYHGDGNPPKLGKDRLTMAEYVRRVQQCYED